MAIDFMAFGEAFLNRTAEEIMKRKEKASDYEDELKERAETNKALINRRKSIVESQVTLANQAKSNGATDEMISAALDSGATGLMDLSTNLQKLKVELGSGWSPEAAKTAYELPEGYVVPEGDLATRVALAYGLPAPSLGSTVAPEASWFDRGMGLGAKDRVRASLDTESFMDGYSVMDINEAAAQQDYQSLTKGAFVNFTMPKVFSVDDYASESAVLDRIVTNAQEDQVYVAMETEITTLSAKTWASDQAPGYIEQRAKIAELRKKQRAYTASKVAQEALRRHGAFTGGGYFEQMAGIVDGYLGGAGSFAALLNMDPDETPPMLDVNGKPVTVPVDTEGAAEVSANETKPVKFSEDFNGKPWDTLIDNGFELSDISSGKFTISGQDFTDVHTFEFNDKGEVVAGSFVDSVTGETIEMDADTIEHAFNYLNTIQPVSAGPRVLLDNSGIENLSELEDGQTIDPNLITREMTEGLSRYDLSKLGLKYSALGKLFENLPNQETVDQRIEQLTIKEEAAKNPEQWYKVTLPGKLPGRRERKVKGADLIHVPDGALLNMNYNTPLARLDFDEDLPKATWTVRDIKKAYPNYNAEPGLTITQDEGPMRPQERPEGLMSQAPSPEIAPTEDNPVIEAIQATQGAEKLLKDHGRTIIEFLYDEGFDGTESTEEFKASVAAWFDENSANPDLMNLGLLPEDMGAVVFGVKQFITENPPA